jgi:hypothetical protein
MSLRGNPAKLSKLAATLRGIPTVVVQRIAAKVAPRLTALAAASFAAGQNAYGQAWPAGVNGQALTLRRTGALASKLSFVAIGTRVRAVLGVPYARYIIGRFAVLPGRALPTAWSSDIGATVRKEIAAELARAA